MTVGELHRRLTAALEKSPSRADWPVVALVSTEDDRLKAYVWNVSFSHDCLPDTDGGDDIHNAGFIATIEAEAGGPS